MQTQQHRQDNIKKYLGLGSCLVLFVVIGLFTYMKMHSVLSGVHIQAEIVRDGNTSMVQIKGNARNTNYITLNGREIFVDRDGTFVEPVALLPGLSVVTLSAQDKFGKTAEKKFELTYTESNGSFAYNETKVIN
jgi:hypothetical protein